MATSINLYSSKETTKKPLTGKLALVLSVALLFITFAVLGILVFQKNRYTNQERRVESEIAQEQSKLKSAEFSELADFQERLSQLSKVVDDHGYWGALLQKMSPYFIPEVRLQSFSGKKNSDGGTVDISGVATNLDALSRELILLKSFPDTDSLEFKGAELGNAQENGIRFKASLKIKSTAFQK